MCSRNSLPHVCQHLVHQRLFVLAVRGEVHEVRHAPEETRGALQLRARVLHAVSPRVVDQVDAVEKE